MTDDVIAGVRRDRLSALRAREAKRFAQGRPRAKAALDKGAGAFLDGVPLHWMKDWPVPHLPVIASAKGARIKDIDGYEIDDFCLGDTGSMFGHSPAPVAKAIRVQAGRGLTYMLPCEDALEAGRLLCARTFCMERGLIRGTKPATLIRLFVSVVRLVRRCGR